MQAMIDKVASECIAVRLRMLNRVITNIYDDAPMYCMQRLTWSGVALHQGVVPNYPASHGCIRMPEAFAQQLWTTTKLGARASIQIDTMSPAKNAIGAPTA